MARIDRRGLLAGAAGAMTAMLSSADGRAPRRPNVVVVLMDDMGWRDLACCGSDFYETPNLDRLAAEGLRFTQAYAACPVCSPTRASLMTGKHPARLGLTNYLVGRSRGKLLEAEYADNLPAAEVTLARALRDGGYATWHVGKWHLGAQAPPGRHGFDVNVAGGAWGHPPRGYFAPWGIDTLAEGQPGEYLTDRLTHEAVELIHSAGERPFFLNLWHYAVHTPIQAPEPLVRKYEEKARRLGLDRLPAIEEGGTFPTLEKRDRRIQRRIRQSHPAYAAMVENVDANIGRVLQALRDAGVERDTLVVFTSDNGGLSTSEGSPTCNLPLAEGKGWLCEGGIREPLLVRWPGVTRPGTVCDAPVITPDLYPTLLAAAGLPARPRQHQDGANLLPLLRGAGSLRREALHWHYPHYGNQGGTPGGAVRAGDWKLIEFYEDGRLELYNLRDDPGEHVNLAAREPRRARALQRRLAAWRRDVGAAMPTPNPEYAPWPDREERRPGCRDAEVRP